MRIEKIAETAPEITELLRRSGGGSGASQGEPSRKQALSTAASVASSIDSSSSVAMTPASASSSAKAPKWKRDSDLLRRAMSSGKGKKIKSSAVIEGSGADSGSNQLVSTAESAASGVGSQGVQVEAQDGDSGLVACPHCNRRFNDKAADRHIPICTDIKAKPKTLLKKSGKPAVSAALPARTKLIGRIL